MASGGRKPPDEAAEEVRGQESHIGKLGTAGPDP
jgi:hypothetical protein